MNMNSTLANHQCLIVAQHCFGQSLTLEYTLLILHIIENDNPIVPLKHTGSNVFNPILVMKWRFFLCCPDSVFQSWLFFLGR